MALANDRRERVLRTAGLVFCSTLALTASFVGAVALLTGAAGDASVRLPYYVLVGALTFVVSIVLLDSDRAEGGPVIAVTAGIAVAGFVLVSLGGEGLVYAVRYPHELVAEQLVVYFVAAALICTGLGYWSLHHWREFADTGHR